MDISESAASAVCRSGPDRFALRGQPPHASSDREDLWFFGRIFDAPALARKLAVAPTSTSDLLLHAYRKWGAAFPEHLEGEYAFALWDRESRRLLLGRDSTGYWPLLYTQHGDSLVFAERVRSIVAWPGVAARLHEPRIAQWLGLSLTPTIETFFENIFAVRPGSVVVYEDGRVREQVFWRPEDRPKLILRDPREYAEGLVEVLERAVRDRLPEFGPVATQLSGGLDSSSVTATAARLLATQGRKTIALTAVPKHKVEAERGRFADEGAHAAAVAAIYPNIDHVLVQHGAHSVIALIDQFSAAQEEPVFNAVNYDWIYEICLQAKQRGARDLLVGFCGNGTISYDGGHVLSSLVEQGRYREMARLAWQISRHAPRGWLTVARLLVEPRLPAAARFVLSKLRGRRSATEEYSLIHPQFRRANGVGMMALDDSVFRLSGRDRRLLLLRKQDFGVLIRAFRGLSGVAMSDPTADRRVIEYCVSVPDEHCIENGIRRSLIRNAMRGRLPEMVCGETRRGQQSADLGFHMASERHEVIAEIARLKKIDLVAKAVDLSAMEAMMGWPEQQVQAYGVTMYWLRILRALSLGRFIRRFEEGSLFGPE